MRLDTVHTLETFDSLAGEWNALLASSGTNVPFLRHEYLRAWWGTRGGGEWDHGDLHIVLARSPGGKLIGAAPLFFAPNLAGEPALLLVGGIEVSDYLDVLAAPEMLEDFLGAVLAYLAGPQAPPWRVVDAYNLPEASRTPGILARLAGRYGWEFQQAHFRPAPCIPLPGDWEAYLAGLAKKQRHEVRRKLRRLERYPEPVTWRIVAPEADLDAEVEAFMALMANDERKRAFLTESMRTHLQATARAAFEHGWLQLAFLEVGGERAAGILNFDYGGRLWSYNSGFNPDFGSLSPGWVLLAELLKWANERQKAAFDFMRGDEGYKYRFGAVERFVERVTVRRR